MFIKWVNNKNICIPVRDQIRSGIYCYDFYALMHYVFVYFSDVLAETEERSVAIFPLLIEDLSLPVMTGLLQRCLHFNISFRSSVSPTDKTEQG
jgi:hypothetical protein